MNAQDAIEWEIDEPMPRAIPPEIVTKIKEGFGLQQKEHDAAMVSAVYNTERRERQIIRNFLVGELRREKDEKAKKALARVVHFLASREGAPTSKRKGKELLREARNHDGR
jgi:hypothetical protein